MCFFFHLILLQSNYDAVLLMWLYDYNVYSCINLFT